MFFVWKFILTGFCQINKAVQRQNDLIHSLPSEITIDNFKDTKEKIYQLYHIMKTVYVTALNKHQSTKINKYHINKETIIGHKTKLR